MDFRQSSSGRVQPTESRYLLQPGTCVLCGRVGRNSEEIFANLGVELEYYGVVYLCLECCAEIADFVNYKSPLLYEELANRYLKLTHAYDTVNSDLARARFLLHARIDSFVSGESDSDGFTSFSVSEVERNSDEFHQISDSDKSESAESGSK